jgi:hypothetical protein
MLQNVLHYGVHFLLPLLVALFWFRPQWKIAFLVMIAAMLIDLDHLLASPIYDIGRCSINFHPLHSYPAITVYIIMLIPKKTRIFGLGLVIHILADQIDCLFM